ncbi:hypothetical protein DSCO28_02830 [Desulfosarcina ovata subsp. sediminis]|uniref:Uncharacterized protein n=1 Tax=Desulfosarcina ovata subsp. sediminis TaxID=885957 RepID=A0A5K7ZIC7_9BACT|nr:hypothetical protein DSCO28_02830 [Desulfosarcina ovata subsp. sediminis]
MVIRRVCAWCGRDMGTKECESDCPEGVEDPITHTICPECKAKALAELNSISAKTTKPNE